MIQRRIFGGFIVLIGLLFLLSALNLEVDAWNIIGRFWPVILIVIGVFNLFGAQGIRLSGVIMIVIGSLFLLETTGFEFFGLDAWDIVLPVVIIIIGIWMLFPSSGNQVVSKDFVKQAAIFSGAEIACDSKEFKGADLFAMFGGISLDLREAEIGEERPVKMDVFAAFGGVDIIVPEGTKVRITGIPLFGGWSNKTVKVTQTAEADMTVNVFVMFGGMDVKNHK